MNFYLDYNIYIYSLSDESIAQVVECLKKKSVQFFYSPAHVEEVYKAFVEEGKNYLENKEKILCQISKFTNNMEYLPSTAGVIIKKESPFECYKRVAGIDTTQRIEFDGKEKYQVDKIYYKQLCDKDKTYKNVSNVEFNKIWDCDDIVNTISQLNNNMQEIVKRNNSSYENLIFKLLGIDKNLPEDLEIYQGMYSEIKNCHKVLEFVIEILFRMLNIYGYNAEKKEDTTISGIHDVSHAIYATQANKLFTVDKRFANKCKAIYHFLGVDTEVILCPQKEISKILQTHI